MRKKFGFFLLTTLTIAPIFDLSARETLFTFSAIDSGKPNFILAQDSDRAIAQTIARHYLDKIPVTEIPNALSDRKAQKIQDLLVRELMPKLGEIIGYKAGLTNPAAQARFQVNEPIQGVLLEKMLLPTASIVPADFGTRPFLEGDLIVRVGSEKINQARTPAEVLESLDAVIPFLELPDLVYGERVKPNARSLVAINVGARLGILGKPIPLTKGEDWKTRLGKIQLIILDRDGKPLETGESSSLLGNPLNVVLWLRDNLQAQGKSLKPGDLLSLGTITPPIPIQPKTTIRAKYLGLAPTPVEIAVTFEEP